MLQPEAWPQLNPKRRDPTLDVSMALIADPSRIQGSKREHAVRTAIVEAIAYADIFDWPLTPAETHRYLPVRAEIGEVEAALRSPRLGELIRSTNGYLTLIGRESLVPDRRQREAVSAALWPRAIRYARAIASLPFVRLVAVTGSLAVGAARDEADVDLFIVTTDGRLWLTRAMTIAIVRATARDVRLCPNYFLAGSALMLTEHDRFIAHELVQMVPVAGHAAYRSLLDLNGWYRDFLPNHPGPSAPDWSPSGGRIRALIERALQVEPIDRLERWEMKRKIVRLGADARSNETRFDLTVCKGHTEEHRRRTLASFRQRMDRLREVMA
jgi:hypothetical protein